MFRVNSCGGNISQCIQAGIHKMLIRIANREDPDQTVSYREDPDQTASSEAV